MKKLFIQIASKYGITIDGYRTYRSDMGSQVFDMKLMFNNDFENYSDSYIIGDPNGKELLLQMFEKDCKKLTNLI